MESLLSNPIIARVVSNDDVDESKSVDNYCSFNASNDANAKGDGDGQRSNGVFTSSVSETVRPIVDVSDRGEEQILQKITTSSRRSSSVDCCGDSHARATTVSQIDKGLSSINTMRQPSYNDYSDFDNRNQPSSYVNRQCGPGDVINKEYYVLKTNYERRMSSLSMGSAKPSRRERYLSGEEQYEMLKLHHLNLLNEIHETALMLNLFEQRQLLREQQMKMRQMQQLHHHRNPSRSYSNSHNNFVVDNSESERYLNNNKYHQEYQRRGASHISDDDDEEYQHNAGIEQIPFHNNNNNKNNLTSTSTSTGNKRAMSPNSEPIGNNKKHKGVVEEK